jgi:hypothetical protein
LGAENAPGWGGAFSEKTGKLLAMEGLFTETGFAGNWVVLFAERKEKGCNLGRWLNPAPIPCTVCTSVSCNVIKSPRHTANFN